MNRQPALLLATFFSGVLISEFLRLDEAFAGVLLERLLGFLLFLIGISMCEELTKLRRLSSLTAEIVKLIASTIAGSALGGLLTGLVLTWGGFLAETGCNDTTCVLGYCAVVSLGMGWYTFTGGLLSVRGSFLGFLGFTSNLLRELLTFTIYPLLPKRYRISGISIGGATTMDTTLPIMYKSGGSDTALLAFIHGTVLTLVIPILLPLILSFL